MRAQQRDATRLAIVDATIDCLVEDGYAALTTRRVAERAKVAQSTVMHHFDTRETLLVEAVTGVALRLPQQGPHIDLAPLRAPRQRGGGPDQARPRVRPPPAPPPP